MTDPDFDLMDFTPYLLAQAAEVASLGFQQYYKAHYGMLRTEWRVLFHLGRYGSMTATEICTRAQIHKTKISRAVAALERKRFLQRQQMQTDRRHETLILTSHGKTAYLDLAQAAQRYEETLMAGISQKERALLSKCLRHIAKI